jgi:dTDP-4-amino-4,6-dideoxygalactose transaminase
MFVGIGGNPANYLEILELCKQNNIAMILDAAHMVGTRNDEGFIGSEADFVVSSFQAVKNLPTADSGMLNSPDAELMDLARKLSWLGISTSTYERNSQKGGYKWEYDVDYVGHKANGNSIMAAIASVQLRKLKADNEFRQSISSKYKNGLSNIDQIRIVEHHEEKYSSARHLFQIRVLAKSREAMVQKLNLMGVDVGVHYRLNTRYKPYLRFEANTPNAVEIEPQLLSLPLHMRLREVDIEQVINAVVKAVE